MQASQGAAKFFLALQKPAFVFKAIGLDAQGKINNDNWRLSPRTDGGHELGGVSADGRMALSCSADSPTDKLYAQPLKANTYLPNGDPTVVASSVGDIKAVDVSNVLSGNVRFVVYGTETGLFLRKIDATTGAKIGAAIPLL